MQNCLGGPCPKCGGTGVILDGIYTNVKEAANQLITTNSDQLKKLYDIFSDAIKQKHSQEHISTSIDQHVPELKSLNQCLPKNNMQLYAFLTFIAYVIFELIGVYNSSKSITKEDMAEIVSKAIRDSAKEVKTDNKLMNKIPLLPKKPKIKKEKPKPGRNDPCPCGSGKKYKKCCI